MKFKATLEDVHILLGVLQLCRSIQKDCIIRLQATRTRFFTNVEATDGVQVWVGCHTESLFRDFRCVSQYKEQSITCRVLDTRQLYYVVKQADARDRKGGRAYRTVLRLARCGQQPVWRMSMQGLSGQPDLSYDVPVAILSDREIESMQAPPLEDERVQVIVPHLAELSTFIDSLRLAACEAVTFTAQPLPRGRRSTSEATLKRPRPTTQPVPTSTTAAVDETARLTIEEEEAGRGPDVASFAVHAEQAFAHFALYYDAVELVEQPGVRVSGASDDARVEDEEGRAGTESGHEGRHTATVTVDVKKFSRFFSAVKDITPTRVSMYLVHHRALVLSVYASNGTTMVAFIPVKV